MKRQSDRLASTDDDDFPMNFNHYVYFINIHIRFNSKNDLFELLCPQIFVHWNIVLFLLFDQLFASFCFSVLRQFNIILISFVIRTDGYYDG